MLQNQDKRLATDLKRRSTSAWNKVYDRHVVGIFEFIFHLVGGDRMVAEELCQETWLHSLEHIGQFDASRGTIRSWLFGIARRQVALYFRRRTARGPTPSAGGNNAVNDLASASLLPYQVLEQVERADAVRAALLLLTEDRRAVLTAKYVDRLAVKQIAARKGSTAKAVESLLSRARAEMRSLLGWYFAAPTERRTEELSDDKPTKT